MKRLLLIACAAVLLSGCTTFEVSDTKSGLIVRTSGAPLVSRNDKFTVSFERLNEDTNDLEEFRLSRNTEEQADAQIEMMRLIAEMSMRAGAAGATGVPVAP